jgi:DNA-binding NarL/FixJ family response regulator
MLNSITYPAYLPSVTGIGSLTKRELDVFSYIDLYDKEIADKLKIKVTTVTTHTQNIRKKTGLANKREMTRCATQIGLIN